MPTRTLIITLLAPLAGCFLALDLSKGGGRHDAADDSDPLTDTYGGEAPTDSATPIPQATVHLDPDTVAAGQTTIVTLTLGGVVAADVTGLSFGPDLAVTTWRAEGDNAVLVAVTAPADLAPGPLALTLSTTRGDLTFPGALEVTP